MEETSGLEIIRVANSSQSFYINILNGETPPPEGAKVTDPSLLVSKEVGGNRVDKFGESNSQSEEPRSLSVVLSLHLDTGKAEK